MARRLLARGIAVDAIIDGNGAPAAIGDSPVVDAPASAQTVEAIETDVEMPGVASVEVAESIAVLEQAAASRPLDAVEQAFLETQLVDASQTLRLEFKDSKNVTSAVLDTTTGVVTVTFVNGKSYRFANFTAELMAEWNTAESAGKWFSANVRKSDRHPQVEPTKE
jgi:hypothetical protein